jgi:hypothetical protein
MNSCNIRRLRPWLSCALGLLATACGSSSSPEPQTTQTSSPGTEQLDELARVNAFIDARYSRADVVHSFKTKFGEDIDCIDFYAQPTVKALIARGEAIEPVSAEEIAKVTALHGPDEQKNLLTDVALDGSPDEAGNARICTGRTVPMDRIHAETIMKSGGLNAWLAKQTSKRPVLASPDTSDYCGYDHEEYIDDVTNQGGYTRTSVYNPFIVQSPDHSLSQTWTWAGTTSITGACTPGSGTAQTVEVGWDVDIAVNGDRNTHLFTYWTADDYVNTGCYDQACSPGFVRQPGSTYWPGMTLSSSVVGQVPIEVLLETYAGTTAWILNINNTIMGTFPYSLFVNESTGMSTGSAAHFAVGGEVYNSEAPGTAVGNQMGTGNGAATGYESAAYHHNVSYLFNGGRGLVARPATFTNAKTDNGGCYFASFTNSAGGPGWGTYFYFGGTGGHLDANRHQVCP